MGERSNPGAPISFVSPVDAVRDFLYHSLKEYSIYEQISLWSLSVWSCFPTRRLLVWFLPALRPSSVVVWGLFLTCFNEKTRPKWIEDSLVRETKGLHPQSGFLRFVARAGVGSGWIELTKARRKRCGSLVSNAGRDSFATVSAIHREIKGPSSQS